MGHTASTIKMAADSVTRKIELKHGTANASVTVVPFGATIISWKIDDQEHIFVSKKAIMDGSKAIRGGVPICFPNFGPWSLGPQHGFARNSKDWEVTSEPKVDINTGDVELTLVLKDTDETKKVWNAQFTFLYKITLRASELHLKVDVQNNGQENFDMTYCFHTYFTTSDLNAVQVTDLKGLNYTDKTIEGWPSKEETNEVVEIKGFTDRVYAKAPNDIKVHGIANGKTLKLNKTGLADWVVWNPYETAAKMADMHENGHLEFVCVEATQTSDRIVINPGERWQATHTMAISS